jgi:alpha-beta hydrolase superfamily lysophospholipase
MVLDQATVRVDVAAVAPEGGRWVAADVFVPARPSGDDDQATVVFCFPGGGMSRRYFDLRPAGEGGGFSMAGHLVDRGFVVIAMDHLGIGESGRPDDGFTLTPDVVADVNAFATAELGERLRSGTLLDGFPPVLRQFRVAVGHSMGARLAVIQQSRHGTFDALALLGIGGQGINIPVDGPGPGWLPPERNGVLTGEELSYAGDPARLRRDMVTLGHQRYGDDPLPPGGTATSDLLLAGMPVSGRVREELDRSSTGLLALCGLTSMIPGSTAPEMAAVAVPVFLGLGARDIAGPPHDVPRAFSGSRDVTLFVLAGAGHNHNVAPNRIQLWDRVASWLTSLQ